MSLTRIAGAAVEFFNLSSSILSTLVPEASIVNTGFAFPDYDTVWRAMDGELGTYVRAQIAKRGILTASRVWDNGFRQITTSNKPINEPKGVRKPHPSFWLGGGGEKVTLKLVAQYADACNLFGDAATGHDQQWLRDARLVRREMGGPRRRLEAGRRKRRADLASGGRPVDRARRYP